MNDASPRTDLDPIETRTRMEPSSNRVEVPAELLNEAVLQLRKLSGIRQREAERQERAIAQLHATMKRQVRLNRYLILLSVLVIAAAAFSGYLAWKSTRQETYTARTLDEVGKQLDANNQIMKSDLSAARESQSELSRQIASQLEAIRSERDQVRGEVRSVLDEKTRMIATQEAAVLAEKAALEETRSRIRQEQQVLIQQTIQQLNAMSAGLQDASPAASDSVTTAPAAEQPASPDPNEPETTPADPQ